jgi:hypothetical protein
VISQAGRPSITTWQTADSWRRRDDRVRIRGELRFPRPQLNLPHHDGSLASQRDRRDRDGRDLHNATPKLPNITTSQGRMPICSLTDIGRVCPGKGTPPVA